MKPVYLAISLAVCWACGGPTNEGQGVKTPDELVAEQERLAEQQAKESEEHKSSVDPETTDLEKKAAFDKRQAELEMKRAARSAETCPGSVTEESPAGTAKVSVTFGNNGHVKSVTINAPYDENAVGKCVLKAMNAVVVPSFDGPEETMEWEIKLEPAAAPDKKDDKKDGKKGAKKK
jgi:hypothetical protein